MPFVAKTKMMKSKTAGSMTGAFVIAALIPTKFKTTTKI